MRVRHCSLAVSGLFALTLGGSACDNSKNPTVPADTTSIPLDDFSVVKTTLNDESYSGATDGTNFLVAFATAPANELTGTPGVQLISQNARIGGPVSFPTNKNDIGVAAFDGTRYLTVMQQGTAPGLSDLFGQFISKTGVADGAQFKVTTSGNAPFAFSLSAGGGAYLLTYARGEFDPSIADSSFNVMARRIGTDGTVGPELILTNRGTISASAFDGTNFFVVYSVTSTRQIRGRFISPAGSLGLDIPISPAGISVSSPVGVAFNGTNYLAAWGDRISTDQFGNDSALFVAPIATDGTLSAPVRIPTSFPLSQILGVTPLGSNFYVNWVEADALQQLGTRGVAVTATGGMGTPTTLFQPDTLTTSVIARLIPISSTKAMAMVNRRIHGQWDVYAKLLTLP